MKLPDEVMKAMGVEWFAHRGQAFCGDSLLDLGNDDCFGSALFVVRGLKWLADRETCRASLRHNDGMWACQWNLFSEKYAHTQTQAVYDAILEVAK